MKKAISKDSDHLDEDRPSKTQQKQAMLDLQNLGSRLVELAISQAKSLNLPEDLLAAILDYHRFPKHEAQRRQLQYIGKIMRKVDPEPIELALKALKGESAAEIARMHRLEDLRVRFLANEKVIDEILSLWPQTDVSYLRQLRRNALREQEQNKPPKSFRLIFKTFKALEKGLHVADDADDELDDMDNRD